MAEKYRLPGYRGILSQGSFEARVSTAIDCVRSVVGEDAAIVATFYDHILAEDGEDLVVIAGSWVDGDFEVEGVSREANPGLGTREDVAQHYMAQMEEAASHLVAGRAREASQALSRCDEMAKQGCRGWLLESSLARVGALADRWPGGDALLAEAAALGMDLSLFGLPQLSEVAGKNELLRRRIDDNMGQIARLLDEIRNNVGLEALEEDLEGLVSALKEAKRAFVWADHGSITAFWELADRCIVNMAASVSVARSQE